MLRLITAVLYTALALAANPVLAGPDRTTIEALRDGSMMRLAFQDPEPVPNDSFTDRGGQAHVFDDWKGQWLVVNFWATWCGPCRKEMPSLDALAKAYDGKGLAVLPIATGRNAPAAMDRFLAEAGVTNLTIFLDPQQELARSLGVLGLPMTLIVDPEGRIVARAIGEADWSGESARAIFDALLAG